MKREMEAYIVLLHLASQGQATFSDIRPLFGWDVWKKAEAIHIIAHINQKILDLSEAWDEQISFPTRSCLNLFSRPTL